MQSLRLPYKNNPHLQHERYFFSIMNNFLMHYKIIE